MHDIWEIKDIQLLKNNGDIEQIEYTHKMNRYHQILLKNLERLIKAIEKGKEEDDCYGLYCRALANKPKKK